METATTEERNIIREFTPEQERREILEEFHLMENLHKEVNASREVSSREHCVDFVGGSARRINKAKSLLWQGKVDDAIATFALVQTGASS